MNAKLSMNMTTIQVLYLLVKLNVHQKSDIVKSS